jgi:hypothetical protein
MSERTIYLRDQAAKCRLHAVRMSDAETQLALRKLAAEYDEQAVEIDSNECASGVQSPARGSSLV